MALQGNTYNSGSTGRKPKLDATNDLYTLSDLATTRVTTKPPTIVPAVTNTITAGQTFTCKILLRVTPASGNSAARVNYAFIDSSSTTFCTLQAAEVNTAGEFVYTFKAGVKTTPSTTPPTVPPQLPGVSVKFSTSDGETDGFNYTVWLFQIQQPATNAS